MHLRLNRKSRFPLHIQLKAQLAHLIQAGQCPPGSRLPTVRQLAGSLRINRNTASRVFSELEREGHVSCVPGRGTFVAPRRAERKGGKVRELLAVIDEVASRARGLGVSASKFAAALYARTHASGGAARGRKVRALFVECNRPQLDLFSAELAEALPLRVESILIEDLARRVRRVPGSLRKCALVVTTFFHVREVRRLLAQTDVEVVGLLAEASPATLMRLAELPDGTRVGVACGERMETVNVKLSIRNAGLTHVRLVLASCADAPGLRRMLRKVSVVVCSSLVAGKIRRLGRRGTEILVDDRRLDRAGIELLRRRLAEWETRDGRARGSDASR